MKERFVTLGIHMDDSALSMAAVQPAKQGVPLLHWDRIELPDGLVQQGQIREQEPLARIIRRFVRCHHLKVRHGIITLPFTSTRSRIAQYPVLSAEVLNEQILEEMQRYSPFGDTVYDHAVFDAARGRETCTVIQTMTAKPTSQACLQLARLAGLDNVTFEPADLSMLHLLSDGLAGRADTTRIFLMVDAVSSSVYVYQGGQPLFIKSIPVGIRHGLADPSLIAPLAEALCDVHRYGQSMSQRPIAIHAASNTPAPLLKAFLETMSPHTPGICLRPVTLRRVLAHIPRRDPASVPLFALACAWFDVSHPGRDRCNLIVPFFLDRVKAQRQINRTAAAIIMLVFLFIATYVPVKIKTMGVQAENRSMQEQIQASEPLHSEWMQCHEELKRLKEQITVYRRAYDQLPGIAWHRVMQTIAETIPADVRLMDIQTIDNGGFTLTGQTLVEESVHAFGKALEAHDGIEKVLIQEFSYDERGSGLIRYRMSGIATAKGTDR